MTTTATPTTTPTPPAVLIPAAVANQALADAVEFAKPYGRMKAIAEALSQATGQTVSRQMVGRWLNEDPAKRVPIGNFGMGLALLYVVEAMKHAEATELEAPTLYGRARLVIEVNATTPKKTNRRTKTHE